VSISLDLEGYVLLFVCSCVCDLDCFPVSRLHCWPFGYIFELSFSLLACLLQGQQLPAYSCSRVLSVDFYFFGE